MLEPFVMMKSAIDFAPSAATMTGSLGTLDTTRSVGAGVTLGKPNDYSLSVTTEVEQASTAEHPNLKSRLEVKVPLK